MPAISRSLNVLARCGNQFRTSKLEALDLSAAQAPYILHVCAKPGQTQEQLARALHVNPSNAARQLARLEEKGYIRRAAPRDNRRQLIVEPCDKAIQAVAKVREVNRQWNDYLTQGMTAEEQDRLEALLNRMLALAVAWADEEGEAT